MCANHTAVHTYIYVYTYIHTRGSLKHYFKKIIWLCWVLVATRGIFIAAFLLPSTGFSSCGTASGHTGSA